MVCIGADIPLSAPSRCKSGSSLTPLSFPRKPKVLNELNVEGLWGNGAVGFETRPYKFSIPTQASIHCHFILPSHPLSFPRKRESIKLPCLNYYPRNTIHRLSLPIHPVDKRDPEPHPQSFLPAPSTKSIIDSIKQETLPIDGNKSRTLEYYRRTRR
jgi:hypothetical protein